MKKLVLPFLLLVLLAAGTAYFLARHSAARGLAPAELLPAGTLAYAEVTDFRRTRERWMHTALRELWLEPEVRNFLEQPLSKLPQMATWQRAAAQLEQLRPRQGFAALLSLEGNQPRWVAGLAFAGDRASLEALLAEPRSRLHAAFPAGKTDLVPYGQAEIQTFAAGELVVAETVRDGWYFVADDLAALKAVLDRSAGRKTSAPGSLADDPVFRATLHPLPTDAEVLGFVHMEPLVQQLTTLAAASGQTLDDATLAEWKRRQGLGFATRIEGSDFKDSLFLFAPGSAVEERLPLAGLALTTPETLFYYDSALSAGLLAQLMNLAKAAGTNLTAAAPLLHQLQPEMSVGLDWPATAEVNALLALPVNPKAKGLPETLDQLGAGFGWTRQEVQGLTLYTGQPPMGMEALTPAATIAKGFLLAGRAKTLTDLAARPAGPTLATAPAYQAGVKGLPPPAGSFAFVQTAALVERLYGTARPALAMALAFNPATMPYLDASKLPSAPVLAKHFGATALSRSTTAEGQLLVSSGPVTLPQLGLLLVGGAAGAFPALQESLPPGLWPPAFKALGK